MGATTVQSVTMHEDCPFAMLLTATDDDGDPITITDDAEVSGYIAETYASDADLLETFRGMPVDKASGQAVVGLTAAEVNALKASATFATTAADSGDLGPGVVYLLQKSDGESITAVAQGTKTFTVAADLTTLWPGAGATLAGGLLTVAGSTGNDGTYTIIAAILSGTDTIIYVEESIPDATVDGTLVAEYQKCIAQINHKYQRGTVKA